MENIDEKSINRNKIILAISICILVGVVFFYIVLTSTFNNEVYFHHVYNQNTGEPIGVIGSFFLYILFWWFAGLIPSSCVFLFSLCLYGFLHRKDKGVFNRKYKHGKDFDFAGKLSFVSTYIAILILMILHISNIVTINIF